MTAVPAPAPPLRRPAVAAAGVAVGLVAFLARPWLFAVEHREIAVLVALGAVGALWPLAPPRATPARRSLSVLAIGIAAFAVGRLAGGGIAPMPRVAHVVVVSTLGAVAEEAFFRRLLFSALEHRGPVVAVVGSAVAFALVHITRYGGWAMPLDITAGLLLSWQRAASGSWRIPAVTHALGNVMVLW